MPNQINRDIYVLSSKVKDPIDYVRLTNDIPIVFTFRDYDIPSGSAAQVYVQKPSGKAVYDTAAISGNVVTVTVTDQMFAELGVSDLQIRITQGDEKLVSFSQPVRVHPNYTEGDAQQSQNEGGFFDDADKALQDVKNAVTQANQAVSDAQTAVDDAQMAVANANQAVTNANNAAQNANEAAEGVNDAVQEAITQDSINAAVSAYFSAHPVSIATPELSGTTIMYTGSIDPSAQLEQDVSDLKEFAAQFNDKTLYTT